MSSEPIQIDRDGTGIATLTLTRSEKHNAMSGEMISALTDAARDLGEDATIRAVILTGEGESFCAGGDLEWMRAQFSATRDERVAEATRLAEMLLALNTLPKPLIGRVNGQAYGGGVGLISVCDIAFAAEGARFGLTETRLGLIPATISPYVAARLGADQIRQVFLSARLFDAEEAVRLGLVAGAYSDDDLDARVALECKTILNAAPGAVAAAKALAQSLGPRIDAAVIANTVARLADTWETAEAQDGIAAFFDRRPPPWSPKRDT